ncbi:hypothetical protein BC834DRAFT_549768 [Gloeopeniophorella convolvens]|nr:hypothetical protein BC834DRAFT_549768 [Gloeopeniophorella convolvens]
MEGLERAIESYINRHYESSLPGAPSLSTSTTSSGNSHRLASPAEAPQQELQDIVDAQPAHNGLPVRPNSFGVFGPELWDAEPSGSQDTREGAHDTLAPVGPQPTPPISAVSTVPPEPTPIVEEIPTSGISSSGTPANVSHAPSSDGTSTESLVPVHQVAAPDDSSPSLPVDSPLPTDALHRGVPQWSGITAPVDLSDTQIVSLHICP